MGNNLATHRDPVCGVDVAVTATTHSSRWQQHVYHFCSAQCQQRFAANPAFYTAAARGGETGAILKRRTLRFVGSDEKVARQACASLQRLPGVSAAVSGSDRIALAYDLRQATFDQIEAEATAAGLVLRGGFERWRRALWKFEEGNEIENGAHPSDGACCNRPPARAR